MKEMWHAISTRSLLTCTKSFLSCTASVCGSRESLTLACILPYIVSHLQSREQDFNVQGSCIVDGVITDYVLYSDVLAYDFVRKHNAILCLSKKDVDIVKASSCDRHYTGYAEKN